MATGCGSPSQPFPSLGPSVSQIGWIPISGGTYGPGATMPRKKQPAQGDLFADTEEDRYRAPGLIEELIGDGKLGRKSRAGFYEYD